MTTPWPGLSTWSGMAPRRNAPTRGVLALAVLAVTLVSCLPPVGPGAAGSDPSLSSQVHPFANPAEVSRVGNNCASGTSCGPSAATSITSGNGLVLFLMLQGGSGTPTITVTDTASDTFALITSCTGINSQAWDAYIYAVRSTTGGGSFTFTTSTTTNWQIDSDLVQVSTFGGVDTETANNSCGLVAPGTNSFSSTLTTTTTNDLAVGRDECFVASGTGMQVGTGWNNAGSSGSPTNGGAYVLEYESWASSGANSLAFSQSGTNDCGGTKIVYEGVAISSSSSVSPPGAGAITPATPTIDNGQSVTLTSAPVGFTPYTYAWYSGGSATCSSDTVVGGQTASTYSPSPSSSTDFCYQVTDGLGHSLKSATDLVTVNSALVAGAVTPSAPTIDNGQSISFSSHPSGGTVTSGYTYLWFTGATSACSTSTGVTTASYSPSPSSTEYVCYQVTDNAFSPSTVTSAADQVTVNSALSSGSPSPSAPSIDNGQSITLTANPSGGTTPYSYAWFQHSGSSTCPTGASSIGGATSSTYVASPTSTFTYCVQVTDSANTPKVLFSAADTVTVNSALVAGAITPASPTIDSGQSVTLTSAASGGTTSYSYAWYAGGSASCGSDTLVGGQTSSTYSPSPGSSEYVCYAVTDSANTPVTVQSATDLITVNGALVAGALTPSAPTIDLGQSITLTSAASGGTVAYTYAWYAGSSATCSSDTLVGGQTATTYSPSPGASEYVCYAVTDSATSPSTVRSATDYITVNAALLAGPVTPASPTIDLGQSISLPSAPSAGTTPYSYAWYAGSSSSCASDSLIAGQTAAVYAPAPAATEYVCYAVTDSAYSPVTVRSATDLITVDPALVAGGPTPAAPSIDLGQSISIAATPTGGTAPLTYAWYAGSSSSCSSDTLVAGQTSSTYVPSPGATEYVCYGLTDGAYSPVSLLSATDLITVSPALSAGFITPPSPIFYAGSPVLLTANPAGGTLPYHFAWWSGLSPTCNLNGPIAGATASTYSASPASSTYFCYVVLDSAHAPENVSSATAIIILGSGGGGGGAGPSFSLVPGTATEPVSLEFVVPLFEIQRPSGAVANASQTNQVWKTLRVTLVGTGTAVFHNWSVLSWAAGIFNLTLVFTAPQLGEVDNGTAELVLNGTGTIQGTSAPASGTLNQSVFQLANGKGEWWAQLGIKTPPPFSSPRSLGEILQDLAWLGDSTVGRSIYAIAAFVLLYSWLYEAHRRARRRIAGEAPPGGREALA